MSHTRRRRAPGVGLAIALASLLMLAACGGSSTVQKQASTSPPLTATPLDKVSLAGDSLLTVLTKSDPASGRQIPDVTATVDDSGLLVLHIRVRSSAIARVNIALTAALLDANDLHIGEATGGTINLDPGKTTTIDLNGRRPQDTIASIRLAAKSQTAPAP